MDFKHYYRNIHIYILCIVIISVLSGYLVFSLEWILPALLAGILLLYLILRLIRYIKRINQLIASFLQGIENEDTTLKIPAKTGNRDIDDIFHALDHGETNYSG